MDKKLESRIRTAIKECIESHEEHDPFFRHTSLGFKRFEILYCAEFTPKSSGTMRTIIVAVQHKSVEDNNVTVFEVKDYAHDKMVAMFDGRACISIPRRKVFFHNVCYGGFSREHADRFFQMMFDDMELKRIPV